MSQTSAWECACGNVEYSELMPEECNACLDIGKFTQLPEELLESREKEGDLDDEAPILKGIKMSKTQKTGKTEKTGKKKTGKTRSKGK